MDGLNATDENPVIFPNLQQTETHELGRLVSTPPPISLRNQSLQPQAESQPSHTDMPPMVLVSDPNENETTSDESRNSRNSRNSQSLAPLTPPANPENIALNTATLGNEERRCTLPQPVTTSTGISDSLNKPAKALAPKKEMFLTFFNDKRPNLRDFVPFSTLNLSQREFFDFYSSRTGVLLQDLKFLTFRTPWVGYRHQQTVWRDGSEEDWRIEVDDIRRLYKITRLGKPDVTDFEIWVQPGYKRAFTPDGDDTDLSRI